MVFVDGGRATVCVDSCVKVFVVVELDRISLCSIELGSSGIKYQIVDLLARYAFFLGPHIDSLLELRVCDSSDCGGGFDLSEDEVNVSGS